MSNPTELPDLYKLEELAKAVNKGRDDADWEFAKAITPGTVLAMLAALRAALARRAQPEGEVPQAEHPMIAAVRGLAWKWHCDAANAGFATSESAVELFELLDTAPAAQHAESGAPAGKLGEVIALLRQIEDCPDDGEPWVVAGKARLLVEALAAQSQGARYVLCLPDSAHHTLAAKAEAPAAQQAAAPDALESRGLRPLCRECNGRGLIGLLTSLRCNACSGTGRVAAAPSAPGTPEEPKPPFPISDDEMAALRRFWECATDGEGYDVEKPMMQRLAEMGLVQRKSGAYYMATEFGLYVLGEYTMERAAQLDGGQGEGEKA